MKFNVCMMQVPPTLRFVMDGEMPDYLLAKDLILQVSFVRCSILHFMSCYVCL